MPQIHRPPLNQLFVLTVTGLLSTLILACQLTTTPATPTARSTREPEPTPTIVVILPKESVYPSPNGRELGQANAPVTVEVFSDFQCPACRQYSTSVEPKIIHQYVTAGQVRLIYRHYPFIGEESFQAARASMCAAKQERFWVYHDILFANWDGENEGAFSRDKLLAFGKAIPLDMGAFTTCINNNPYQSVIDQDLAMGKNQGVAAVPSVYVNGKAVTPGRIPEVKDMQKAINEALGQP